ncbi:Putative flavin-containing monooxygenase 2 [Triticum urartu]|uniref:L-ornithine N(5)-monooxygenase [NAD(P)H] n=1 Tax=Triticum urartu TaxID=4572 RepID=M7YK48_TRIUA|nr:Putative flavin-containing monooxygenase 2 [Triticum urartu]
MTSLLLLVSTSNVSVHAPSRIRLFPSNYTRIFFQLLFLKKFLTIKAPALPYLPTNLVPLSQVRFRSRVVAAEYVDAEPEGAADRWERWNGNGEAFGDGSGVWRLTVGDRGAGEQEPETEEVHESDFLILCIGSFSGVPNIPAVSPGPEAFRGRVLHCMELSHMADEDAAALVKGKRITVVGSGKSAFEITAECADANGAGTPCTMLCQNPHWLLPSGQVTCLSFSISLIAGLNGWNSHTWIEGFVIYLLMVFLYERKKVDGAPRNMIRKGSDERGEKSRVKDEMEGNRDKDCLAG